MTTDAKKTEVGSYFISNYPPYSLWSERDIPEIRRAMNDAPADAPLGLYVHIPFCRKRCKFCYFKVFTDNTASEIESYVAGLSREIERVSRLPVMGDRPFRFVYFGGGTPSFLSVRQLRSLEERLRASIDWSRAEEVTFECEPGTLSESKVLAIRDLGVTRLSLGVENFSDAVLSENGRAHLSEEIDRAWRSIERARFPNVNVDLIAGMVGETWDNWRECVRRVLDLAPDSVTIYQLELPFNTVYSQDLRNAGSPSGPGRPIPVADWPTKRAWVGYAFDTLESAGYRVSSGYTMIKDPARVHFHYRDQLWQGADLLATGIASFGHVSGVHYQNVASWSDYLGALLQGDGLPIGRALRPTHRQRLIREMILQLKRGRLDTAYFESKFGTSILDVWGPVWSALERERRLTIDGTRITLTRDGLLRVDELLPAFFEPEHRGVRYT
ncbi:MAG: coproporphyrinogen III oxidase family protein [Planctomycetes bacterium]|nr:coproporphyrinogen III oxidase family protein [Planctomycetota bacterium]